ncbi:MAG: AEC family transporter [Propionibacteriaceae bacterium]|jgi:predicted permease|nr:AEC family transporter [Propionibacteriaceae bacterium]
MGFVVTAQQVLIMFVMIALGVIGYRAKLFGDAAVQGMTRVLLYIVTPCVIIQAFDQPFDADKLRQVGVVFGLDLASFAVFIALAAVIFNRRVVRDAEQRVVVRFGAVYSNAGFIGIPLAQAILGAEGVFYAVAFVVAFNVWAWTQGISSFDAEGGIGLWERVKKIATRPAIVATVASFLLFASPFSLPEIVQTPVSQLASMNTPLSMIVIGGNLAAIRLRSVATDKLAWAGMAARNVLFPLLAIGLLTLLPLAHNTRMSILIPLSCPVGAFLVMFSVLKGNDTAFPTKLMTLSTLASVATLPVVLALAQAIWA